MSLRRLVAPIALALALAGCGTHVSLPGARMMSAGAIRAHARDVGTDLIGGLRNLATNLNTFSATVDFWETDGKNIQTNTADVYTAHPGKIRANITASNQPLKKGANVLYLGDKKVTVKLGFIKRTLDYTDPQVLSMHGWRIDQTDLNALLAGLTDPAGQATAMGPVTVNGVTGQAVSVTSPTLLPGVTSETVVVDPNTFVPLQLEASIQGNVVYRLVLSKAQINPNLPANIFSL